MLFTAETTLGNFIISLIIFIPLFLFLPFPSLFSFLPCTPAPPRWTPIIWMLDLLGLLYISHHFSLIFHLLDFVLFLLFILGNFLNLISQPLSYISAIHIFISEISLFHVPIIFENIKIYKYI